MRLRRRELFCLGNSNPTAGQGTNSNPYPGVNTDACSITYTHTKADAYANAVAHTKAKSDANSITDTIANANSHTEADADPNAHALTDTNTNPDSYPNTHTNSITDTDANPDSNAPLGGRYLESEHFDRCAGLQGVSEPDKRRSLHIRFWNRIRKHTTIYGYLRRLRTEVLLRGHQR
jgi:hypothetical protein